MDWETLFALYIEMSSHIEELNREVGALSAKVDWMEWWLRNIIRLVVLEIVAGGLVLVRRWRNGRNNHGKRKK